MSEKREIRTRFAPSPTGELHIGGLRSALSSFLYAKKNGGKFILRIEDTDQSRFVDGSVERIVESLEWAGLKIDEGVMKVKSDPPAGEAGKLKVKSGDVENDKIQDTGVKIKEVGDYGPYIQSKRIDIYKKYVQQLIDEGKAYYCFCSAERLDEMRKEQQSRKEAPKYDRCCLKLSKEEIEKKIKNGEKYVVRFKIPEGKTIVDDLVYGKIEVENETLGDTVILKSDGFPTYHLAVVADDYLMKITHVFRGAEWIASAPIHVLLYKAFGWEDVMPEFAHMPNILNQNKKKLSKREGSVSVRDFRDQGYPAEAIINFIALLGWNPKTEEEIFTMDELIDKYDIEKVNRAGAVFDMKRLDWISSQHIKKMEINDLYERTIPFLEEKEFYKSAPEERRTEDYIKKILAIEKDRLEKFTQVGENNQFFFSDDIKTSADKMRWKDSSDEDTKNNLEKAKNVLENISEDSWSLENIERELLETAGDKRGDLLFPLRAALTGAERSPSPFEVAWVLGKEKSLERINKAIESL